MHKSLGALMMQGDKDDAGCVHKLEIVICIRTNFASILHEFANIRRKHFNKTIRKISRSQTGKHF